MLEVDTIVATATPVGRGGIGIVRLSGPDAWPIATSLFSEKLQDRYAVFGDFLGADGGLVDQGLALAFVAPRSYTGEHIVEFQGHGGPLVMQQITQACIAKGARLARPGEFTERAFTNGKMDLVQAEAIADLINSDSVAAAQGAAKSLQGEFSSLVQALAVELVGLRMVVEGGIDFPDEEADFHEEAQVAKRLSAVAERLFTLRSQANQGALLNQGISMALIGAPNVGKSSLLNVLSGEDRAIVTEVAGTTRDVLNVDLVLRGLPIRLVDTAGIRSTEDKIESEGVRRAIDQAASADIIVLVEAAGEILEEGSTGGLFAVLTERSFDIKALADKVIRVLNKADLLEPNLPKPNLIALSEGTSPPDAVIVVSALNRLGIDDLIQAVLGKAGYSQTGTGFSARARHLEALDRCTDHVAQAQDLLKDASFADIVAEELNLAHQALGSIVGQVSADDLLGEIFANFCIGK